MQDEVEDKSSMIPFLYSLIKKPSPEIKEKSKLVGLEE
jgi:hypothetical protein